MESLQDKNLLQNEDFRQHSIKQHEGALAENRLQLRKAYLDAYRKYQAAANYGEFERVYAVDQFAVRLYNKDWAALDNTPAPIKYFLGEVGFGESGLVRRL